MSEPVIREWRSTPRGLLADIPGGIEGIATHNAVAEHNAAIRHLSKVAGDAAKSIRRVLDANPDAYRHGQAELIAAAQWLEQATGD